MKKNNRLLPDWKDSGGLQQVSRMMKCVLFFMLTLVCGVQGKVYSQQYTLDLHLKQTSLEEVFNRIEAQTGLKFLYNTLLIDSKGKVDVEARQEDIRKVLAELLNPLGLTYILNSNHIVVKQADAAAPQEKTVIKGKVTDSKGSPLPGVTVRIKGTNIGVVSDNDGHYELTLPAGTDPTLIFSFVGMLSQEAKYTGQKELNIIMHEDVNEMEEVVVTGIFERKEEGFTGSATTLNSEDIRRMTSGNVLKALEMADPGFKMNVSNLAGSNPNVIPDFQMRGQASMGNYEATDVVTMRGDVNSRPNQPLFVLDGVIGVSATTIMDLDPGQVESITLLKDAAATVIYGSEAANGVVVVETKSPEAGKLRFTYNGNYKLEMPDLSVYDLTDAKEKLQVEELAGYFSLQNDIDRMKYHAHLKEEILRGVNTYWLSKPLRTGFSHRHGIQFEGGDRALRYKVYLGANFAPGIMKETDLNTKTGKVDLLYRFKKFLISNQLSIDYSEGKRSSSYGSFKEYTYLNPYYRPYDDNGNIVKILDQNDLLLGWYGTPTTNPLWNTMFGYKDETQNFIVREALRLEYTPIEALRLRLDFTLSRSDGKVEVFKSAQHTDFEGITDPSYKGSFDKTKSEGLDYRVSLTGSYNKAFGGEHLLSAFAQYSITENSSNMEILSMKGFPNDRLDEVFLGTSFSNITGNEGISRALGFVMTLNYSYKQRYAVDYSMRLDASSQFGKNNRMAPFWSAGLRWNAEKEEFVKCLGIFDELILRGSYGVTGSQDFSPYQALQAYTYEGMMKAYKSFDVVGAKLYSMGNPDLKWQKTKDYNVSLDFSILKNLISAKVEYYHKHTENTLLDYALAPSVGFSNVKDNLGTISNKGVEATLRVMPYSNPSKQAYMNIVVTGARNKSTIEKISNALKYQNEQQIAKTDTRPLPRYESGYSQTIIWAVPSMGIDPISGEEVFLKRNGALTSVWNAADQVPMGDTEPKFAGTYSVNFQYKGFGFTLAGTYKWGGQMYNYTLLDKVENANLRMNVDRRVLTDRWKEVGDKAFFKKLDGDAQRENTKASSRFIMDENEFTLKTINLSYRMDAQRQRGLAKAGIGALTVGMYVEDVLRLSTVKMERGIDYPFSRSVSLSLNVVF